MITKKMNMLKEVVLIVFAFSVFCNFSEAQDVWSLEKCVNHALENSNEVKTNALNIESAKLTAKQAKLARLPSLNANIGQGWNFGRQIDPVTNDFINQQVGFNTLGVGSSMTLFNGGSINNTIKKSKIDQQTAELNAQSAINDLILNVVQTYVTILLAEEQVANVKTRVSTAEEQLKNTDKLIQAGSVPRNDRLQILANIATEEQNAVIAVNNVDLNYNILKQLLQLDPEFDLKLQKPDSDIPITNSIKDLTFDQVYQSATKTLPEVAAQDLRLQSAELDMDIARANLMPTLTLSGSLSSNFSTAGRSVENTGQTFVSERPVFIDGTPSVLGTETPIFNVSDNPYSDQINENFGQSVQIGLSIPIFNARRARTNVEQLKLQRENIKLQKNQTLNTIKSNVQRSYNNARSTSLQYEASKRSLEAQAANYENVAKRYELGAISTFEYITAKNNLDSAQLTETISRYDYIFAMKVLDFYLGKRITID